MSFAPQRWTVTYIATHVPLPPVTADQLLDLLPLHVSGPWSYIVTYLPTKPAVTLGSQQTLEVAAADTCLDVRVLLDC